MKPEVIILNDMINRVLTFRYSGPYLLAHKLRQQGYRVKVIDWFTKLPMYGADAIKSFASPDLKYVLFSSTFLMTKMRSKDYRGRWTRKEANLQMVSDTMWFEDKEQMADWFHDLKFELKQKAPDVKFAIGGIAVPRIMYFIPELAKVVDLMVSGYGENAMLELLENKPIEIQTYNGFRFWKVPPEIQSSAPYPFTLSKEDCFQPEESAFFELARGCAFRCKFCTYDNGRTSELGFNQIRDIFLKNYDTFGITRYHFIDNCINTNMKKVKFLHDVIKSLPFEIEWTGYVRPELFVKFPEMLEMLVETGAGGLYYGVETLHQKAGSLCGKGGDKEKFKQSMIEVHRPFKNQIFTTGSMIVGLPGEPIESIRESMDWMLDERPFHLPVFGPMILQHPEFSNATRDLVFANNDNSVFSTSPEKYGLRFTERYKFIGEWEHDQMTFEEAVELSAEYSQRMRATTFTPANGSFDHMTLRGMGYSREKIANIINSRDPQLHAKVYNEMTGALENLKRRYFRDILNR